jgi:hypothetical protein
MKHFSKLALLSIATFVLIGCGGGSSSNNTTDPDQNNQEQNSNEQTTSTTHTVKEAKADAIAMSKIGMINSLNLSRFQTTSSTVQQKIYSDSCPQGGSFTYDVSDTTEEFTVNYAQCKLDAETLNGSLTMIFIDENNYEIIFNNFTHDGDYGSGHYNHTMSYGFDPETNVYTMKHNGTMKQTENAEEETMITKDLTIQFKNGLSESWSKIDGELEISSKCLNDSFTFKTTEKLVEAKDKSGNLDSGIIEINGAMFTFENPNVTIKTATEEETILQSELDKEIDNTTCNL